MPTQQHRILRLHGLLTRPVSPQLPQHGNGLPRACAAQIDAGQSSAAASVVCVTRLRKMLLLCQCAWRKAGWVG